MNSCHLNEENIRFWKNQRMLHFNYKKKTIFLSFDWYLIVYQSLLYIYFVSGACLRIQFYNCKLYYGHESPRTSTFVNFQLSSNSSAIWLHLPSSIHWHIRSFCMRSFSAHFRFHLRVILFRIFIFVSLFERQKKREINWQNSHWIDFLRTSIWDAYLL